MTMTRDFKLFHIVFLVFAWQCCAKVSATFNDVTGVADLGLNHQFSFRAFGSHGFGFPNVGGHVASSVDIQSPTEAPGIAPIGIETLVNKGNKALSFGLEINKGLTASLGLKFSKRKGNIVVSHGHEISRKSGVNIATSNVGKINLKSRGSVVSNGGKIGLKSRGNVVIPHGIETPMSNAKKAFSFGLETKKSRVTSLGLKTPKSKGDIFVSHGHKINLKNGGSVVNSHGLRHGFRTRKSGDDLVHSHGF